MTIQKPLSQPGCEFVDKCIEYFDAPSVWVEDRGVRATFLNPRRKAIRKIFYDGCYSPEKEVKQADFIVSLVEIIDVIVELKGSDTNLTGDRGAGRQVEYTLHAWRQDTNRSSRIAALIIFGRIEGKKKRPGRVPRAEAAISGLQAEFQRVHKILLLIHENGEKQFSFNDFLRKKDAQ